MRSEPAVERVAERSFRLRCPCGETIVTSNKTVTCSYCGKAVEILRVKQHSQSAIAVERLIARDFHFHCPCGAAIVPRGKAAICPTCGSTIEIRRNRKHKHRWNIAPRGGQSVWHIRDLRKLLIYAAVCALLLCYLYDLVRG
jgi:rRNA maturation endonuclease Nob1